VDGKSMNNKYSGSTFDEFLAEEGILEEVSTQAQKRLLVLQINDIMTEANLSKSEIAFKMETSRSQLDRLLDPENTSITLESLDRLARAVGKHLKIELA
jgi:predicted XRE-type DNA-binding protein